jgi:hypothetical protein
MLKRTLYPLLLAIAAAWLATPADAFQQRLYRRAEAAPSGDANCLLLCHFDGTDGQTTNILDSSASAHTITLAGDAQLDTAQKQYGTASLLLDGTGDYASLAAFDSLAGDFTVELWAQMDNWGAYGFFIGNANHSAGTGGWGIARHSAGGGFVWLVYPGGGISASADGWSAGTWHHIALTRSGSTVTLWLDGASAGTVSDSATWTSTNALQIGQAPAGTAYSLTGNVDEIRISNTARYTSAFTPAGPFTP